MSNLMNKFLFFFSFFSFSFSLSYANDQQELVERSKIALQSLMGDEGYKNNLASLLDRAKGVIIIPALYKAGFILGGEGGNGVVLSKLLNGEWSYPFFLTFLVGSVGMQIGGIGELAPTRRADLAKLGLRALLCGTLASYLSATIAGILMF